MVTRGVSVSVSSCYSRLKLSIDWPFNPSVRGSIPRGPTNYFPPPQALLLSPLLPFRGPLACPSLFRVGAGRSRAHVSDLAEPAVVKHLTAMRSRPCDQLLLPALFGAAAGGPAMREQRLPQNRRPRPVLPIPFLAFLPASAWWGQRSTWGREPRPGGHLLR